MRLTLRIYLWFLLVIATVVLSMGALFFVYTSDEYRRSQTRIIGTVQLMQRVVQRAIDNGVEIEAIEYIIRPLLTRFRASFVIYDAEQRLKTGYFNPDYEYPDEPDDEEFEALEKKGAYLLRGDDEHWPVPVSPFTRMGFMLDDGHGSKLYMYLFAHQMWDLSDAAVIFMNWLWLILLAGLFFSFLLAYQIARPLQKMSQVATKIAGGQLEQRTMLKRKDEIGILSNNIDAMASSLQHKIESQRRLLADISHELRAPLARIRMRIELMLEHQQAESKEHTAGVIKQIEHIDELIDELLTYSRLDMGGYLMKLQLLDMKVFMIDLEERFSLDLGAKNISLVKQITCTNFLTDKRLLERIMNNLLKNSIEHMDDGGEIAINISGDKQGLKIKVLDQGKGVDNALLKNIFEPFVGSAQKIGSGLGLSIVKLSVEALHGKIAAHNIYDSDSHTNIGLAVSIDLPVLED